MEEKISSNRADGISFFLFLNADVLSLTQEEFEDLLAIPQRNKWAGTLSGGYIGIGFDESLGILEIYAWKIRPKEDFQE